MTYSTTPQTKKIWFQGLTEGLDQATDTSLTKGVPYMKNVILDQVGNWASRKGTDLVFSKISANPGYGLWTYNNTAGTHKLFAVADRDLFVLNESTGWNSAVDTDQWPASKMVNGIDHLNRSYTGSSDGTTALGYTTGSTVTDIIPIIGGDKLAVNKSILAVSGNNLLPNVAFLSDPFTDTFYSATGTCSSNADSNGANTVVTTASVFEADIAPGAILYNSTEGVMRHVLSWTNATVPYVTTDGSTSTWDNDTVYVLKNNFKQDGAFTGITGYQENFLSFDEQNMYMWDPISTWSQKLPGFGCTSHRSLQVIDGNAIWANRDGLWLFGGQGLPQNITSRIQDKVNGYAIWDIIDPANWGTLAAGVKESEGKYFLSLGTLQTVSGAANSGETNALLIFDTRTGDITYRSAPDRFLAFTNFVDVSGNKNLYGIGESDAGIWKIDTGTTDDDSGGTPAAFTTEVHTPHHQLDQDPTVRSKVTKCFVKYTCSSTVTVKHSADRGTYSSSFVTLPISSTPITKEIDPLANNEALTHSLSFASTGKLIIEGYGFLVERKTTTGNERI